MCFSPISYRFSSILLNRIVTSVEYFAINAALVAILEMWCGQRILSLQQQQQQVAATPSPSSASTHASTHVSSDPPVIQEDLPSPPEMCRWCWNQIVNSFGCTSIAIELPETKTSAVTSSPRQAQGEDLWSIVCSWTWRFSPDILVLGMAFSLTCFGELCQSSTKTIGLFIESMLVPFGFILFLAVSLHQRGMERWNVSRWLLESELLNFIGYGSYPIYLIQNVFLQYYFTFIFHVKDYDYHPTDPGRGYFQGIPLIDRFIAVIVVILIGWLIQTYVQDYLVANAFSKVLMWWTERQAASKQKKEEDVDGIVLKENTRSER